MAKNKTIAQYYFSPRLEKQLALISKYSLTVVEAPSGFGKTTALREYLDSLGQEGQRGVLKQWYTCFGESPERTWAGICNMFRKLGGALADALANLGVPTRETLPDIADLLQQYSAPKKAYFVIDNYQLFATKVPKELLTALAACCRNNNLHLIVITQHLDHLFGAAKTTHSSRAYHVITGDDFAFDNAGIARYCRLAGIAISMDTIEQIQATSQGWIAAIRLQLKHYQESDWIIDPKGINDLVETAVWNKLSDQGKEFMLGMSLLDYATHRQAVIMNGGAAVPAEASDLRVMDFFVRRVPDKNAYFLHAILRDYLSSRFAAQAQEFKHTMLRRAAAACLAEDDYWPAARFFMRVEDYDAILAMPLNDLVFSHYQGEGMIQFFARLFEKCPLETLRKYPLMVITVGIQFYKEGRPEDYVRVIHLIEEFIKNPPGPSEMSERELYRVKGEFEMLLHVTRYNDMEGMAVHIRKAHEYLSRVSVSPRSYIFAGNPPWAMGMPSALASYWSQSGELRNILLLMDSLVPLYTELTCGHGAGGATIMHAEAAAARGDDSEAEALCHKAIYVAQSAEQRTNRLCAELVLARIGLVRGDEKMYAFARKNIAREIESARQTALTREGEMAVAHLDLIFGKTNGLPNWLRHPEAIRRNLYKLTQPYALMLHSWLLLLEKRWAEFYALTEMALKTVQDLHYPLLWIYHLIFLARARLAEKRGAEAAARLREVLGLALPDRVYQPLAEHAETLLPLMEKLKGEFDGQRMLECLSFCRRWGQGVAAVHKARPGDPRLLTPRQAEILSLAAKGQSNAQIAARLGVSPDNVNKLLRAAYGKLNARNRVEAVRIFLHS